MQQKQSPHEGYFYANDYIDADDDGRPIDRKRIYNVVGKFADHEMVDCAATKKAEAEGKFGRVMRTILVLRERVIKDAANSPSMDETVTPVKPHNQSSLIRRYPEAWAAYQEEKSKAAPQPALKAVRKPRAKKGESGGAEIVELQAARG